MTCQGGPDDLVAFANASDGDLSAGPAQASKPLAMASPLPGVGSGDQNSSPTFEGGMDHFMPPLSWSLRNFRTCSLKVSGYWKSEACPESG